MAANENVFDFAEAMRTMLLIRWTVIIKSVFTTYFVFFKITGIAPTTVFDRNPLLDGDLALANYSNVVVDGSRVHELAEGLKVK